MTRYVTNMDQLFAMTERKYRAFTRLACSGVEVREALEQVGARSLGLVVRVTDWTKQDAYREYRLHTITIKDTDNERKRV